jgi:DNA-directed RNA polymerase specialized sigma24 family protein
MVERAEVGEAEAPVVSAVSDGPPAFEAEFDHLFAAAYRAAFRLLGDREEASDCAQEALTRAYPRWERLRRGEPASWVVRVAANLAIDRWRRQQRSDRSEPIAEAPHVANRSSPAPCSTPRSPNCPDASARSSCSGTSATFPRPRSRRPSGSRPAQ